MFLKIFDSKYLNLSGIGGVIVVNAEIFWVIEIFPYL